VPPPNLGGGAQTEKEREREREGEEMSGNVSEELGLPPIAPTWGGAEDEGRRRKKGKR
jgi:hypothetical protein